MRFTSVKFFAIVVSIIVFVGVVVLPATINAAEETRIEQIGLGKSDTLDLVSCGGFWDKLTVGCFVPQLTYYLLYIPAMGLLALSGYIFDFVLALSIDHVFINQGFVEELWKIIRDFSNMIFIFILLYTGIQTIFGMGKWQQTILQVVIIALLVNFSMFFTKVVIDAGNILALGVYEGMGVTKVAGIDKPHKPASAGQVPERTVSATLVNALNPQQFAKLSSDNKGAAATIFIVSAIVCAYAAFIFIKASLLFIGRVIAFWFLIAISPFALISMTLPKGNIWGWWTNTLINQAFVAPVFLIFIYFIMAAIGGIEGAPGIKAILGDGSGTGTYFDMIIVPIVITVMIIYAMQRALGVAKGMADKFGGIGADAIGKAMSSFPMGMALGGGAALLRTSVGSRAGKLSESGIFKQWSSNPNSALSRFTGRTLQSLTDKAHNSSFDVRNSDTVKWATKNAKSAFDVKIDLGKGGGKGGYEAIKKNLEKATKEQAEKMKVTDSEKAAKAAEMNPGYSEAKKQEEENRATQSEATMMHNEAVLRANSTREKQSIDVAEESVKRATTSFKSVEGGLIKKIEELNKRQAEAVMPEEKSRLQEEIDEAEKEKKKAKDELEKEEQKLADAKKAYEATAEAKFLKETEIAVKMASDTYERGQKVIRDTEKMVEVWEDEENIMRREFSAENTINSIFASPRWFMAKGERQSLVKKIRKGTDKDKKKQDKMIKDLMSALDKKAKEGGAEDKKEEGGAKEEKEGAES